MKATPSTKKHKTIVLGGGLAGLSAAYHMGKQTVVFEAAHRPGGECVTDSVGPYRFDKSGHLLHLRQREIIQFIERLFPGKLKKIKRDARIYLEKTEFEYPFQANIRGLACDVKMRAISDFLRAASQSHKKPTNFLQWSRQQFGETISKLFLEPYNRKLWTVDPSELSLDWMGNYMPQPDVQQVISGAFISNQEASGYNASFQYPKSGGIELLANTLAGKVPGLKLNSRATQLNLQKRTIDIVGHGQHSWERLISTIPLPALVALVDSPSKRIMEAMQQLRWSSVVVVNLAVARDKIHPSHWIYFPEKKYPFYRVGFPSNFSKVAPRGHSTLYAEVACPAGLGWATRKPLARQVQQGLINVGILREHDVITAGHLQYIPYAYVIFDQAYTSARRLIMQYLDKYGVTCIGRWGGWEYSAMEDALFAGKQAAKISKRKRGKR